MPLLKHRHPKMGHKSFRSYKTLSPSGGFVCNFTLCMTGGKWVKGNSRRTQSSCCSSSLDAGHLIVYRPHNSTDVFTLTRSKACKKGEVSERAKLLHGAQNLVPGGIS